MYPLTSFICLQIKRLETRLSKTDCTDSEGRERTDGDQWKKDSCTTCECRVCLTHKRLILIMFYCLCPSRLCIRTSLCKSSLNSSLCLDLLEAFHLLAAPSSWHRCLSTVCAHQSLSAFHPLSLTLSACQAQEEVLAPSC